MRRLQLSLIQKWFDMTNTGIKLEDYRAITPYFCNKFLLYQGRTMPKKWWIDNYFEADGRNCSIEEIVENIRLFCTFKDFNYNVMTLGYPKSTDTDKILTFEHAGIEIGYGNPEWGADADKLYFIIKHGNKI